MCVLLCLKIHEPTQPLMTRNPIAVNMLAHKVRPCDLRTKETKQSVVQIISNATVLTCKVSLVLIAFDG